MTPRLALAGLLGLLLFGSFQIDEAMADALKAPQVPSDWDLYMLRLVNRARTDPVAEDLRQGTQFQESAAPPLAYSRLLGRAAQNHSEWMGANRNNPALRGSYDHHETLDGSPNGPTAEFDSVGWSGDRIGDRLRFVGYQFNRVAENIHRGSAPANVDARLIESHHTSFWRSSGHRRAIMNPEYTAFGTHMSIDNNGPNRQRWVTELFARPRSTFPSTHIFGLLYWDADTNNEWTPRSIEDPLREGLKNIPFEVISKGNVVAKSQTFENGGFSLNVGSGQYDLVFADTIRIDDVNIGNINVDVGDLAVQLTPGDANRDLRFDQADIVRVRQGGKYLTGLAATWGDGDWTSDGRFDQFDVIAAVSSQTYRSVPKEMPPRSHSAFREPANGWLYTYHGNEAYSSGSAALDGTWDHNNGSDSWDGSAIGHGKPGGVSIMSEGDTVYARFQDTGDPRLFGFDDPSNRKIFVTRDIVEQHDLSPTFLDDGFTFSFRARLATGSSLDEQHPHDGSSIKPWPLDGLGMTIDFDATGMFSFYQPDNTGALGFSLASPRPRIHRELRSSGLLVNSLNGIEPFREAGDTANGGQLNLLPIDDLTQWHDFWITVEEREGGGTHVVNVYLDGDTTPHVFEVTAGVRYQSEQNSLGIGLPLTEMESAMDLDFLSYTVGVIRPMSNKTAVMVPEPQSFGLLLLGYVPIVSMARRRQRFRGC